MTKKREMRLVKNRKTKEETERKENRQRLMALDKTEKVYILSEARKKSWL